MRLLELVIQGVPGSPAQKRIPVGQGVSALVPGAAGALSLVRLVRFVLYDESVEPPQDLRLPGAEAARAAVTVQDPGGAVYRVVRDLVSGAAQLLRYEAAGRRFELVSSRPAEIGQYLRAQARVPGEDVLRDLFTFSRTDLPSRQPRRPAEPEPASRPFGGLPGAGARRATPAPTGLGGHAAWQELMEGGDAPGDAAVYAHLSLEEKRAKVAELEALKATLDEVDRVQFHLDGLQAKIFELDEGLKRVGGLEGEVQGLEAQLAAFGDLGGLPEDFEDRVKEYAFLQDRLSKTLSRIEGERDTLGERLALAPEAPWKNRILLGGLGAAVVATGLAIGVDGLRWLALVNPFGLGAAAFVLFEWIGSRERHAEDAGRHTTLEERARDAQRRFEVETSVVRKVMKDLGVDAPEKILERYAARSAAAARLDEARGRLEKAKAETDYDAVRGERARIAAEIEATEARLASASMGGQDARDLQRDIDGLRAAIARAERGEPEPEPDPPAVAEPTAPAAEAGAPEGPPDPTPILLDRLGDVFHAPGEERFEGMAPRLGQYLAALTDRAFAGAALKGRGLVLQRTSGESVPWDALDLPTRDRVYRALRLAFAEAALAAEPQPLLFDGFFADLPAAQRPLVRKMLHFLGARTQVLHQDAEPAWAEGAQSVLQL